MIIGDFNKKFYTIEGEKSVIMTEITMLLHEMFVHNIINKADIRKIVELAQTTEEEAKNSIMDMLPEIVIRAAKGDDRAMEVLAILAKEAEEKKREKDE